jgi:hypothetical protein
LLASVVRPANLRISWQWRQNPRPHRCGWPLQPVKGEQTNVARHLYDHVDDGVDFFELAG